MVQMDRAMTSSYRLSIVTMSIGSDLDAILNAKLLPTASNHVNRITVSYPSVYRSVR